MESHVILYSVIARNVQTSIRSDLRMENPKKTLLRRHFEKFYIGEIMEPHNVYKINELLISLLIGFGLLTPHLDI